MNPGNHDGAIRGAATGPSVLGVAWLASRPRTWAAVLMAASLLMLGGSLARPLATHEIYVAQTAREMLDRGDWVFPTFGGEPRLNKPPLMYWAVMALAGPMTEQGERIPEWMASLPSALAAALMVGMTIVLGRSVYSPAVGIAAGAMVVSTLGFYRYGASARPDMLYASMSVVMLTGFVCAWRSDERREQLRWSVLGWIGLALALLAKGPQIPACLLLGLAVHPFASGEWRRLIRVLHPLRGAIVVAGIVMIAVAPNKKARAASIVVAPWGDGTSGGLTLAGAW